MAWRGLNAWRSHSLLTPNSIWEYLPGLKKAIVVFGAYCVVDAGYNAVNPKEDDG